MAAAVVVAPALATPAIANVRSICVDHAAEKERAERIPRGLVQAVALAESGRWLRQDNSTRPWPWTVTSGSDSFYLASKSEAIAKVEELQASGRTNIDVGCMQINLHYHPDAFATLEEAFDPVQNIAYGTKFLKDLRHQTRSWGKATAYYHSQNRDRGQAYRDKVYKLWRKLRRQPVVAAGTDPAPPGGVQTLFRDRVKRPLISRRPAPLWKRDAIPILRGG
jgi:hypothetical protein